MRWWHAKWHWLWSEVSWMSPPTPSLCWMSGFCHDCDRTHPCSPCPDLPTSFLSHQNHSRAPNATPEPSGSIPSQLVSQQCTPEHSDSLVSSRRIPDPTLLQPFLFLASSRFLTSTLIPDPMPFNLHSFVSSLFLTSHQSHNCGVEQALWLSAY